MTKSCAIRILSLVLLTPEALRAQDWNTSAPVNSPAALATAVAHTGTSPFSPREEDDTRFIIDAGSGLDTGCTYRSGGPLKISLPIKRYVGPTSSDGTLRDPQGLVSSKLISAKAHLRLPAFDVDIHGGSGIPPEVDRIFFNGHDLGTLTGDNAIWKLNEFEVPIEWVKFPTAGTAGTPPIPAINLIEIHIDEASAPSQNWCTSIDWVEIEFNAVAPIFLVHGTHAQSDTWAPHFTEFFSTSGAPWSNDINLKKDGSILGNGALLATRLQELATSFGAKKCHVIAHSKGGLDTRAYLNQHYTPEKLTVLSVYTLSTPHHGTILSDLMVAKRAATDPESSNANLEFLIKNDGLIAGFFTPQEPAISDQTTAHMGQFNKDYPSIPGGIRFYNYGAAADTNNSQTIETAETAEMLPNKENAFFSAAATGSAMYRTIGNTASIKITVGSKPGRIWGVNTFTAIEVASLNSPFAKNDLVVSLASAQAPTGSYLGTEEANHSSIKSTTLATTILKRIVADFPNP